MIELGSEFNLSLSKLKITDDNLFHYLNEFENTMYFDSGRSALKYITCNIPSDGLTLLPEFICESVINCFDRKHIAFYKIEQDFTVNMESIEALLSSDVKVIFLMHYFGSVQPANKLNAIKKIAIAHDIIIIEDTTHSIFSKKSTIGDYVISSIRKWMPISKGGVLYVVKDTLRLKKMDILVSSENDRANGMVLKDLFLKELLDCNTEYRKIFADCEERLDRQNEIYQISDFSRFIISCMELDEIISRRRKNYRFLSKKLEKLGFFPVCHLRVDECPYVFPVYLSQRDIFRRYLMQHRIYCAVHWPFDGIMEKARQFAIDNANSLISLPIDQRYGEDEMEYMVDVIANYKRGSAC